MKIWIKVGRIPLDFQVINFCRSPHFAIGRNGLMTFPRMSSILVSSRILHLSFFNIYSSQQQITVPWKLVRDFILKLKGCWRGYFGCFSLISHMEFITWLGKLSWSLLICWFLLISTFCKSMGLVLIKEGLFNST